LVCDCISLLHERCLPAVFKVVAVVLAVDNYPALDNNAIVASRVSKLEPPTPSLRHASQGRLPAHQ
jgi:hypothetical protein